MLTTEDESKIRAIVRSEIQALQPGARRAPPPPDDPLGAALPAFLDGRDAVTVAEVVEGVLGLPPSHQVQGDLTRAASALAALGWERSRASWGPTKERRWRYYRPGFLVPYRAPYQTKAILVTPAEREEASR